MTLKTIPLKPKYISLQDDVAKLFYIPVMSNCRRFDRISCYFTFDAIAKYCTGIYHLGINGGKLRLLISNNISKETFDVIREGFIGQQYLDDLVKEKMRQELSLDDLVTLSNLAYLMKCGLVEIKFVFCYGGLFHEKSGYAEDEEGNCLCFNGSNNETKEAFENNYEKFEVTASWLSSDFDLGKITATRDEFDSMWNEDNPYVIVMNPPESFNSFLQTYNRGTLCKCRDDFLKETYYLDECDNKIHITVPSFIENPGHFKFNLAIQGLVDETIDHTFVLKPNLSKRSILMMVSKIQKKAKETGYEVIKSKSFIKYLAQQTSMDQLALLGISIKQRESSHIDYFNLFKKEVEMITENHLRDEQLWDSYFAFRLKKSANFSVPGSGKTATALGMFAFLNRTLNVNKIVVIGPMNCFDSWISEFKRVFGNKIPLKSITSTEMRSMGNTIQYHVRFDLGPYNLILLNYESFDHNIELTDAVQSRIDDKTMLVFDEVHRIKAINGKRSNGVIPIAKNSKYTIVMTGTPIPNSYSDVYNFLHILYNEDYDNYFNLQPRDLIELKGDEVVAFNKKLQPFYCRTTKNKLNVPPANMDNIIRVFASKEETQLFEQLHQIKMNPLALMIRILQIESNPSMLKSTSLCSIETSSFFDDVETKIEPFQTIEGTEGIITSKIKACINLVKELVESNKPVIVWCIFIKNIDTLSKLIEQEGISVCTVCGNTEYRQEIIDGFKNGKFQVMITNPQTLAESVSLHKVCHDAIYFEYSYNLIHILQSKDRIHRLGLSSNQYTQYHYLETVFDIDNQIISLDEEIHNRLDYKEKVMLDAIENDNLECFKSDDIEIEEILQSIGFSKEMFE